MHAPVAEGEPGDVEVEGVLEPACQQLRGDRRSVVVGDDVALGDAEGVPDIESELRLVHERVAVCVGLVGESETEVIVHDDPATG